MFLVKIGYLCCIYNHNDDEIHIFKNKSEAN